jgi:hypothetical protein
VGDFLTVEQIARTAAVSKIPVIVDAAAEPDVRPYLAAGADLVITSAHKLMGAPTSGMLCGRKGLIRACYLQNWGIGRAMKVGKESIAGCMAAVELWYSRDEAAEAARYARLTAILAERLDAHPAAKTSAVIVNIPRGLNLSARQLANRLREGDPPVWVREATPALPGGSASAPPRTKPLNASRGTSLRGTRMMVSPFGSTKRWCAGTLTPGGGASAALPGPAANISAPPTINASVFVNAKGLMAGSPARPRCGDSSGI